jgi:hypothetical protein
VDDKQSTGSIILRAGRSTARTTTELFGNPTGGSAIAGASALRKQITVEFRFDYQGALFLQYCLKYNVCKCLDSSFLEGADILSEFVVETKLGIGFVCFFHLRLCKLVSVSVCDFLQPSWSSVQSATYRYRVRAGHEGNTEYEYRQGYRTRSHSS